MMMCEAIRLVIILKKYIWIRRTLHVSKSKKRKRSLFKFSMPDAEVILKGRQTPHRSFEEESQAV